MLWDEYFDEDRLNRGYDYYIKDKVFDIILTDDYVTAKVEGSKQNIYEVKITFKDEKIDSLYCTCPYCYADFNCKHMVATLYKRDEILKNKEYDISDENYNKILIFEDILK
ncbi:MAG: SWIM zinc finger family protein, partial [Romboutsia sp.]|nr:SWIM zinc finger family protein [Romboutsia sp.]